MSRLGGYCVVCDCARHKGVFGNVGRNKAVIYPRASRATPQFFLVTLFIAFYHHKYDILAMSLTNTYPRGKASIHFSEFCAECAVP